MTIVVVVYDEDVGRGIRVFLRDLSENDLLDTRVVGSSWTDGAVFIFAETATTHTMLPRYMSQACDAFVYRRFHSLGDCLHERQWRFLILPMLLMVPCMAGEIRSPVPHTATHTGFVSIDSF